MKVCTLIVVGAVTLCGGWTLPVCAAQSGGGDIVSFDAPGADITADDYNGTFPSSINDWGSITGSYVDSSDVYHGFLRGPGGRFVSFQVPGADTTAGSYNGTVPNGINDLGEITGYYTDTRGLTHGFLRDIDGKFTTFDVPGAGGYSFPIALNVEGTVVGYYLDPHLQFHAFLRRPNGTFLSFDGPGACNTGTPAGCYGSAAFAINVFGTVAAGYEDNIGNFVDHGLLRTPDGKLTSFTAPGSGNGSYQGTGCPGCALGLNASGATAGTYIDSNNVYHGYLRSPAGHFTTFEAPGAGEASYQGTGCSSDCSVGLNDYGEIVGSYLDSNSISHGYFRSRYGEFATVDPPGSTGTSLVSINELGATTGYYVDANNAYHGFLRIPSLFR